MTAVTDAATDAGEQRGPVVSGFEEFLRDRLAGLLAYAVVLSGDREVAADVVQEVMLRAHPRWARISRLDRPELYVKRMVTNEYLSWRRRWHVRSIVPVHDDHLIARAPSSPDPSGAVVERDDAWRRLATLPRRQRTVLVLRYYEGLDDTEIAAVLGTSASTVRSNASRALATLRADPNGQEQL